MQAACELIITCLASQIRGQNCSVLIAYFCSDRGFQIHGRVYPKCTFRWEFPTDSYICNTRIRRRFPRFKTRLMQPVSLVLKTFLRNLSASRQFTIFILESKILKRKRQYTLSRSVFQCGNLKMALTRQIYSYVSYGVVSLEGFMDQ